MTASVALGLLGDAGYCASPGSGQGTSLALVGAYVLAGELAEAGGDYQAAFARYENALRDYVEVNQKLGMRGVKVIIPRTQTDVWVRAQMIRLLAHLPWKRFLIGQTTRAVQTAANAINLKHYER